MKYSSLHKEGKWQMKKKHQNAKSIIQESESFKSLLANMEKKEKELALVKSWSVKKKNESEEHYKYRMSVRMDDWPFLTKEEVTATVNRYIYRVRCFKKAMKWALLKAQKDLSIACGPDFLSTKLYNYEEMYMFFANNDDEWEEERLKKIFSKVSIKRYWDEDDGETRYTATLYDWNISDTIFEERLAEAVKDKYERGAKHGVLDLNSSKRRLALIKNELLFNVWKFRTRALKEDLMTAVWHPKRVQSWLAYDDFKMIDSFC